MVISSVVGAEVILTALSSALVEEEGRKADARPGEANPKVSMLLYLNDVRVVKLLYLSLDSSRGQALHCKNTCLILRCAFSDRAYLRRRCREAISRLKRN